MSDWLVWLVPVLFAGINTLELSAVLAREAGIHSGNVMLGYSLNQSVYMGTRFCLVFLLPMLGFLVDSGVAPGTYALMVHGAILLSFLAGLVVLVMRQSVERYFVRVMERYKEAGGYVTAFVHGLRSRPGAEADIPAASVRDMLSHPARRRMVMMAIVVFFIYTSGMFASFYLALIFQDYRASISHSAGLFNAFGAVLLTFYIEPYISREIDGKSDDAATLVMSLFIGRLLALGVASQLGLGLLFLTVG